MSQEKPVPQEQPTPDSQDKPQEKKHSQKSVIGYLFILFAAAFLLLLLAYFMQQRNSEEIIGDLRESMTDMQAVNDMLAENSQLRSELQSAQEALEESGQAMTDLEEEKAHPALVHQGRQFLPAAQPHPPDHAPSRVVGRLAAELPALHPSRQQQGNPRRFHRFQHGEQPPLPGDRPQIEGLPGAGCRIGPGGELLRQGKVAKHPPLGKPPGNLRGGPQAADKLPGEPLLPPPGRPG